MRIHFISGMPRAGSTLLSAILRQNPRFRAEMTAPLCDFTRRLIVGMSQAESGFFVSSEQRKRVLRAVGDAYYRDSPFDVVFDTSRGWSGMLPLIAELYPESRVICMLRSPAWALDSFERIAQRDMTVIPKTSPPTATDVYQRCEDLMKRSVGSALRNMKQAWFSEQAQRMIAVRYESLTEQPQRTMRRLYSLLEEPEFEHGFSSVEYDSPEFDGRLNMPGLHRVSGPVVVNQRESILPPDLFKVHDKCFWEAENPRGVVIL